MWRGEEEEDLAFGSLHSRSADLIIVINDLMRYQTLTNIYTHPPHPHVQYNS